MQKIQKKVQNKEWKRKKKKESLRINKSNTTTDGSKPQTLWRKYQDSSDWTRAFKTMRINFTLI